MAADMNIEGCAFADGRYQDALAGETRATMSAANGQKIAGASPSSCRKEHPSGNRSAELLEYPMSCIVSERDKTIQDALVRRPWGQVPDCVVPGRSTDHD